MRAAAAALTLACAMPLTAACAADSYAGISLAPGTTDAELQALAQRAQAGDKEAQLALGIRYEEGRGVPADRRMAIALYRLAARDSGGTVWTHSPSVRGVPGSPIQVDRGPYLPGLTEAQQRLERLQRHGVPPGGGGA